MPEQRIPLMLISSGQMFWLGRRFRALGRVLMIVNPRLDSVFQKLRMDVEPEGYAVGSLVSSFFYGLLLFIIASAALFVRTQSMGQV